MTKLIMPDPAAYVRFADNGNIRLWSKSAYEGEEFMKPLNSGFVAIKSVA